MSWPSGLPPAAAARIERQRAGGLAGSLLSAPAAAAVHCVGLAPVGVVMGCVALSLGIGAGTASGPGVRGRPIGGDGHGCGWLGGWARSRRTPVVARGHPAPPGVGYGPYARVPASGWKTALQRLVVEASPLGADGVLGLRLTLQRITGQVQELMALGTAVRRADPAAQVHARSRALGGENLVVSSMSTRASTREVTEAHRDLVATCLIIGTTLGRSAPGADRAAAGTAHAAPDVDRAAPRVAVLPLSGRGGPASRRRTNPYGPRTNPFGGPR